MLRTPQYKISEVRASPQLPLDFVKNYLRVIDARDDPMIATMISAAIDAAEHYTKQSLLRRRIGMTVPIRRRVQLPLTPVLESEIAADTIFLAMDEYYLDTQSGELELTAQFKHRHRHNLVINYLAGYEQIPEMLQEGILRHVAQMYDRQDLTTKISQQIFSISHPYRKLMI